jgi:hypothetical protein
MTDAIKAAIVPWRCSRRDVIRQLLGFAGIALAAQGKSDAQVQQTIARVDLHHHFFSTDTIA